MNIQHDSISDTMLLDAPLAKVWNSLTAPDQMALWFETTHGVEGKMAVGEDLLLKWESGNCRLKVVELSPMNRFAYRWHPADFYEGPITDEDTSLVTFSLEEVGDKTKLTMVESGLAHLEPGYRQKTLYMNSWGWGQCFSALRKLVEPQDLLPDSMSFQCAIEAPLERVWGFLSSPAGFRDGMGFPEFEGDIVSGGNCTFVYGGKRMRMRFESVTPMESLSYRWTPGECSDAWTTEDETTLVTIQLIPYEGKTLLLLKEEGFSKFLSRDGKRRYELNLEGWGVEVLPMFKKFIEAKGVQIG